MNEKMYDDLVNKVQREMSKLYEQNLEMKDEIAELKQEVNKHRQFLPMQFDMERETK